jgi:hypothetical protein
MPKTRKTSRPEWAEKPLRRRTLRLCDWCFRSRPRCQDSLRLHRGWHRHDTWKNHPEQRRHQWRERPIMSTSDQEQQPGGDFARMVLNTRTLLESQAGQAVAAERSASGVSTGHLSWMLAECLGFHGAGKVEKANRWLGYVQGVLACSGTATLEQLKRANMPEGAVYDAERVGGEP